MNIQTIEHSKTGLIYPYPLPLGAHSPMEETFAAFVWPELPNKLRCRMAAEVLVGLHKVYWLAWADHCSKPKATRFGANLNHQN